MPDDNPQSRISFVISTFDSDRALRCLLACLDLQTVKPHSVWIADNAPESRAKLQIGAHWDPIPRRIFTSDIAGETLNCYTAADLLVTLKYDELAEWLCFPSDDNYYVPGFSERMLRRADDSDFIYCNCIYDPRRTGEYDVFNTATSSCQIDKGGFIVRKDYFARVGGFSGKIGDRVIREFNLCTADGIFVECIGGANARMSKVAGVLWNHN